MVAATGAEFSATHRFSVLQKERAGFDAEPDFLLPYQRSAVYSGTRSERVAVEKQIPEYQILPYPKRCLDAETSRRVKHPGMVGVEARTNCRARFHIGENISDSGAGPCDEPKRRSTGFELVKVFSFSGESNARFELDLVVPSRRDEVFGLELVKRYLQLLRQGWFPGHAELDTHCCQFPLIVGCRPNSAE